MNVEAAITTKFNHALVIVLLLVAMMSYSLIFLGVAPHIPILCASLLLICYGLWRKVPYKTLETGFVGGASSGMGAVFLFFFIGILVASWMMSGTIPTIMYVGFQLITPTFFLMTVFIITGIVGIAVGSSLTTVATIGVAFLGMASALDISLAMAAGAIVSGAFFGDKMSPLSDTTTLASSTVGVDLFEHIRNMGWTTIPAFIISALLFAFLSPTVPEVQTTEIQVFQKSLLATGLVHWYSWLPVLILLVLTIRKTPALLTLAASSLVAILLALLHSSPTLAEVMNSLFNGFVGQTGNEAMDALLTRGGMVSMMFTVGLVLLALSMGGLLFTLDIIQSILRKIEHILTSTAAVIIAAASTAIGINLSIGEQYLSILLTGQSYKHHFEANHLAPKNLSRVMEDAGTVINPLVPWSVCGIFITKTLGVEVIDYLPFAFFCLLSPLLTVLLGITGKTLTPLKK